VMGVDSLLFLCATRLLAAWLVLPFMYVGRDRHRIPRVLSGDRRSARLCVLGGFLLIFWQFQNPLDFLYSVIKGMTMRPRSCSWRAITAITPAVGPWAWARRPPSQWSSTSSSSTSSACSEHKCSGAVIRELRSEDEMADEGQHGGQPPSEVDVAEPAPEPETLP